MTVRSTALMLACAGALAAPLGAGAQQAATGGGAATGANADVALLSRAGEARALGADTAKVVLIEFIDFACPTCQLFHVQRGDSLRRAIGTDVRLAYVTLLHPNFLRSYHAAEAANCASVAGGRDGYTAMADRLFRNADEWSNAPDPSSVFKRFARETRIDTAAFDNCRALDLTAPLIISDLGTASQFGVTSTPTFVAIPRGAQSPDDAFSITGNVSIAQLNDLILQARAKAR